MAEPNRRATKSPRKTIGKRQVPTYIMVLAFVLVAGLGYLAGSAGSGRFMFNSGLSQLIGGELDLSSVQQTYQTLKTNYDGEINDAKLVEGANKGLVEALGDPYTVYMNPEESAEFDNSLTGNIGGGVGIEVGLRNKVPTVVRVLKDNPAEQAGVMTGDVISKVNDESVIDASINDVVSKIRGDVGTTVKLTLQRGGSEVNVSITRQQVNNPSAYGEVKNGIGILTITRFDDQTGNLARSVAQGFKNQDVKGVVLDLRGNGGGYVTAAQAVAGIWLDKQLVVTEKRGSTVTDELKASGAPILNGIKTVVLVNQSSASASEIVAGALRDNKVATLVGMTTYGKGSVQKLLNMMDNSILKVTVARWYTPSGVNISEKGIVPDMVVDRTATDINNGQDPQLDAALKELL